MSRTGWRVPGSRHGGGSGSAGRATKTSARRTSSSGLPVQHPPHKAAEKDGDHANYEEKPELSVVDHHCLNPSVEAWRRAHPGHTAVYAAKQAAAVILAAKQKFLLRVG